MSICNHTCVPSYKSVVIGCLTKHVSICNHTCVPSYKSVVIGCLTEHVSICNHTCVPSYKSVVIGCLTEHVSIRVITLVCYAYVDAENQLTILTLDLHQPADSDQSLVPSSPRSAGEYIPILVH